MCRFDKHKTDYTNNEKTIIEGGTFVSRFRDEVLGLHLIQGGSMILRSTYVITPLLCSEALRK